MDVSCNSTSSQCETAPSRGEETDCTDEDALKLLVDIGKLTLERLMPDAEAFRPEINARPDVDKPDPVNDDIDATVGPRDVRCARKVGAPGNSEVVSKDESLEEEAGADIAVEIDEDAELVGIAVPECGDDEGVR